jgi:hypothetical protein
MPSSTFTGFDVVIDNDDGTITPVPTATVHGYDVTHSAALADVVSDSGGHVASQTLAVAVGTVVRYHHTTSDGRAGYCEGVTV